MDRSHGLEHHIGKIQSSKTCRYGNVISINNADFKTVLATMRKHDVFDLGQHEYGFDMKILPTSKANNNRKATKQNVFPYHDTPT